MDTQALSLALLCQFAAAQPASKQAQRCVVKVIAHVLYMFRSVLILGRIRHRVQLSGGSNFLVQFSSGSLAPDGALACARMCW